MSAPIVFAGRLGLASVVLLVSGPLLALAGLVEPNEGFSLSSMAGIVSALASGLALVALIRRDRPGSAWAWAGVIGAFVTTFVTMAYAQRRGGSEHWDAVTSREAPVVFVTADVPPVAGAEVLDPRVARGAPTEVFARVVRTARDFGWEVRRDDAEARHLEALVREGVFGFRHDVAIEVRVTTSSTAMLHGRARSRWAHPDGGSNARMLESLFEAVAETP